MDRLKLTSICNRNIVQIKSYAKLGTIQKYKGLWIKRGLLIFNLIQEIGQATVWSINVKENRKRHKAIGNQVTLVTLVTLGTRRRKKTKTRNKKKQKKNKKTKTKLKTSEN